MTRDEQDRRWMRRALALARRSEGHTRPNPPVGALVVKNGRLIGSGRHLRAGLAHAEIAALDDCRVSARGATLYVTLEPCCTQGRTPPCTERILREGVRRVVVGCLDPHGAHDGRGLELLAAAGVEVALNVCAQEAADVVEPFAKWVSRGWPFVTLKLAMTLDGRIADRAGASRWITGAAARAETQRLRRRADAVLVGAGTVCADDPSLLCRLRGAGQDLMRVVVDGAGRTPPGARVYTDGAAARTIVAASRSVSASRAADWTRQGARVWRFPATPEGRISLKRLLRRLGDEGCLHVLCEGGGTLAGALHDAGLIDEYLFFYAPVVMGDARAVSGFSGAGATLNRLSPLRVIETRRLGDDLLVRGRREA